MKYLGLDIGTTTISAVVTEGSRVLASLTQPNDSAIPAAHPMERLQDPVRIRERVLDALSQLLKDYPEIAGIGVTGQMHGIVYLNAAGVPVSPLYTWQDGRGNLPYDKQRSYAGFLSTLTGYDLSTGFGLVTHFYNQTNGLVPESAVVFCTIHDYIAMVLAGNTTPVTEASDAASFGLFSVEKSCYDAEALAKAGIDPAMLPALAPNPCIGVYEGSIPVYAAIGDNQASFLGATGGDRACMLVNVGTGSQFSVFSPDYLSCPGLETRPFPGGYLIVGASLCGGRAYALLERFLASAAEVVTGVPADSCYEAMDRALSRGEKPDNLPNLTPLFQGTRENPALRGSITGLDPENFTFPHLIWAMLEGMAEELHAMYLRYIDCSHKTARLVGSGNGLRKNKHLQASFSRCFGQPLQMSDCLEEAAVGATLYAAIHQAQ